MLHRSALEDEARLFHPRRPSGPFIEPPSGPLPNRPNSRTSRPGSRNRMAKSSVTATPMGLGLGVVTENAPDLSTGDPRSTSPIKEGLGSLNRWSRSTSSSKSPSDYAGHRRGSSKVSLSSHSPHRGTGLVDLPELSLPELRASELFPTDSTSHPDLSFTASSQIFHNSLVHDPGSASYSQSHDAALTSEGAVSVDEEGNTDGQKHGQTQKAMLSKALQKANTAVLLDNAANFEGAMEAYTDACQLLQLVMLRSNGGDEEKLKLQEIVGLFRWLWSCGQN